MLRADRSFSKGILVLAVAVVAASASFSSRAQEQAIEAPDFNNVIRPILSENCFVCHGPDETQRKANLRLDLKTDVFSDARGYSIVVPGKPDESPLYNAHRRRERALPHAPHRLRQKAGA